MVRERARVDDRICALDSDDLVAWPDVFVAARSVSTSHRRAAREAYRRQKAATPCITKESATKVRGACIGMTSHEGRRNKASQRRMRSTWPRGRWNARGCMGPQRSACPNLHDLAQWSAQEAAERTRGAVSLDSSRHWVRGGSLRSGASSS